MNPPPCIPRRWVRAARAWLADGNVKHEATITDLFASVDLAPHWRPIERRAIRHQVGTLGRHRAIARGEVNWRLQTILLILVARGSWQPATSPAELRRHRNKVAAAARRLAAALEQDPYAAGIGAAAFLNACDVPIKTEDPAIIWRMARPDAPSMLQAFADNVEQGATLDVQRRDERILSGTTIYRGRDAGRRQMEALLSQELQSLTGAPCDSFVAAASSHVFALTTADEVGARRRNRATP